MNDAISMMNGLADAWGHAMFRACWQGGIVVLFVWLLRRLKVVQEQSPVSGNAGIQ